MPRSWFAIWFANSLGRLLAPPKGTVWSIDADLSPIGAHRRRVDLIGYRGAERLSGGSSAKGDAGAGSAVTQMNSYRRREIPSPAW